MENGQSKLPTSATNVINCVPKLVCVQYPGIVNNVDKAIETLGGLGSVEIATATLKKNLELRFRPKDYYCKPSISERDVKPNLLVKLKIRKELKDGKPVPGSQEFVNYDVVGVTALNFKFNKLCDFQFLPLLPPKEPVEAEEELEYVYNKIVPEELPDINWLSHTVLLTWQKNVSTIVQWVYNKSDNAENVQFFFPPAAFSKFNSTNNQLYFDRSKFYEGRFTPEYYKKFKEQELQQKMVRKDKGRTALSHGGFFCNFEDDIPLTPPQACLDKLKIKYISPAGMEKIQELFEERPIWSKQALLYHSHVSLEQIKHILPAIAYHYISGPWRVMWVKFGYDPRKDPATRIYQTFDYRVRSKCGFKLKVKPKRSYTGNTMYRGKLQTKFSLSDEFQGKNAGVQENAFLLTPGMIPSARQMFYQFCDVKLPEIEAMMSRLPPVLPGMKCHKKNGWLPAGFTEQCREIANKYVGAQVQRELQLDKESVVEASTSSKHHTSDKEGGIEELCVDEFLEISDSSSSSSESEDEAAQMKPDDNAEDSEDDIDLETVEEVNRIISMTTQSKEPKPGPSGLS